MSPIALPSQHAAVLYGPKDLRIGEPYSLASTIQPGTSNRRLNRLVWQRL